MKKSIKKSAAKVFTFLLCLSLLTGCSDSGSSDTTPTSAVTGTESDNSGTKDNNDDKVGNTEDGNVTATPTDDPNGSGTSDKDDNSGSQGSSGLTVQVPEAAQYTLINIEYKNKDLATSYVPGDCTSIVFSDNDVKVVGKETEISKADGRVTVKIIKKGDYLISGSCSNGQIIVEAGNEKDVRLILNGVNLTCTDSAPIYEKQCDKMVITLADGSENVLSDTSEYIYDNVEKQQPDSVIFAKDDLVINGNGTLKVNSVYMEGIHSTDSVKLISGNINVNSGDNGVRGKEGVIIKGANLAVTSKGDSIRTTYSDNTSLGYVIIEGGNITLNSAKDGIQATGHIQITGGTLNIKTDGGFTQADEDADTKSSKGIKSENNIYITDATLNINTTDDGIKNGGNLILAGGSVSINSEDDALKSDGSIVLTNCDLNVLKSKEGMKGKNVYIGKANVNVISESDGIKASSKGDSGDDKVRAGDEDAFSFDSDIYVAVISGTINIKAGSDCIDSDGNLFIAGGTITIDSPKIAENNGISYDGNAYVTGGSVVATGVGDIRGQIEK